MSGKSEKYEVFCLRIDNASGLSLRMKTSGDMFGLRLLNKKHVILVSKYISILQT